MTLDDDHMRRNSFGSTLDTGYRECPERPWTCSARSRRARGEPDGDDHRQLDVEPQQVVLGESEAADWRLCFYRAVRSMPVVSMQPDRQFGGASVRMWIGVRVGPFA